MAKQTGLGHRLLVGGVDISGDVTTLDEIAGSLEGLECTGIDKSARERLGGVRDGMISATSWFNPTGAHAELGALPTSDVHVMYLAGSAIGAPAACMVAQQANYAGTREDDGSLTHETEHRANGYGLEWGDLLTAGIRSDTTATNGASLDYGATIDTTSFGLQAYLQVLSFTGTSCTVKLQESGDDGGSDSWADVTGGSFGAQSAVGASRIQTSRTQDVERYLRVATTGTFSECSFVVVVVKNITAVAF
ncbi:MAG: hypothetical protein AB7W59_02210 [Acidimicrobiia bacterium]